MGTLSHQRLSVSYSDWDAVWCEWGKTVYLFDLNTNSFFQQVPQSWQVYVSYDAILPLREDNKEKSKSHESLLIFDSNITSRIKTLEVISFRVFFPQVLKSNGKKRHESRITRFIPASIFISFYYYVSVIIAPAVSEAPKDQVQELLQLFSY